MLYRLNLILIFCLLGLNMQAQSDDPVLLKVGNSDVHVSEFKYIYEKNNGEGADYGTKSLTEYLDLYTKFKLKVEKARELQLDTISSLKQELEGYRKQLAGSYLIDKEVTDALLKELYGRMDYDVEFAHIFMPLPEHAARSQQEEVLAKMREAKSKLVAGVDFSKVASLYSEDKNTNVNGGYMGYMTAKLPSGFYNLETAIYETPIGAISDIVRTKIGYHIVKVINKRKARGIVEVAQILIDGDNFKLADSIYHLVLKGEDFETLVKKYSIDKNTIRSGGRLAPFGINTYDTVFETTSFLLKKDGDVSTPVKTTSGYHIIKRLHKYDKDTYDIFVKKMKAQLSKDERFDIAKVKLVDEIKKSAGFKENKEALTKFKSTLTEEFYTYKWMPDENISKEMLISIGKDEYSVASFGDFCKKNTKIRLRYDRSKPITETVDELYKEFINESALSYEEQSLETKYPDFKSLMREYQEGILLFEVTKMNVWDKANQDTIGLKNFFQEVKDKYVWPEKASLAEISISNVDKKTADKIRKYVIKNDLSRLDKKYNKKSKIVSYTTKEVEKGDLEMANLKWEKRAVSPLIVDESGMNYTLRKVLDILPSRPKTLAEARGYVVADYQEHLEKEWLQQLYKEYNVVVYKDVFNSLKKN